MAKPSQPFLLYHFSDCVFHLKGFADVLVSQPFSARTPRMALRQRILNTSSLRVSLDLRVHVSDAYVAMGTIRALYSVSLGHCLLTSFSKWPLSVGQIRRRESYTIKNTFSDNS